VRTVLLAVVAVGLILVAVARGATVGLLPPAAAAAVGSPLTSCTPALRPRLGPKRPRPSPWWATQAQALEMALVPLVAVVGVVVAVLPVALVAGDWELAVAVAGGVAQVGVEWLVSVEVESAVDLDGEEVGLVETQGPPHLRLLMFLRLPPQVLRLLRLLRHPWPPRLPLLVWTVAVG
jgi:hypothetical protein